VKLPIEIEAVHPDAGTRPFWEFCSRRELRFQRCAACGGLRHPPKPGCPHCGATEVEWARVTGRGRVFSYTIIHHPTVPALADSVPYNVVVVEFDDAPGVRLISNLVGVALDALRIGMEVDVVWDEVEAGSVLPRFRALA
jgi:uncharacterized OB-fold protein